MLCFVLTGFIWLSALVSYSLEGRLPHPRKYATRNNFIHFDNDAPLKINTNVQEKVQHENMLLRKSKNNLEKLLESYLRDYISKDRNDEKRPFSDTDHFHSQYDPNSESPHRHKGRHFENFYTNEDSRQNSHQQSYERNPFSFHNMKSNNYDNNHGSLVNNDGKPPFLETVNYDFVNQNPRHIGKNRYPYNLRMPSENSYDENGMFYLTKPKQSQNEINTLINKIILYKTQDGKIPLRQRSNDIFSKEDYQEMEKIVSDLESDFRREREEKSASNPVYKFSDLVN